MDDILHLVATGGSAVGTLACCALIWYVSTLRDDIRDLRAENSALRDEAKENSKELARLDGELRGIQDSTRS